MQCTHCAQEAHPLYGNQCEDCWSVNQYGLKKPRGVSRMTPNSNDPNLAGARSALGLGTTSAPLSARIQRVLHNADESGFDPDVIKRALGFT